jgi:F-type H+-transporting ATPase subunit b
VRIATLLLALFVVGGFAVTQANASGGDGHSEDVNLSPLPTSFEEVQTDLAIWTGVIFVLLLLVLGKFAWGPIADGLDKREQRIAGEIEAAEKANADAKAQLEEYQQKLGAAGDEVRQLIEQAKHDAEATGQTIVQKARDEAEAEKRRAVEDIELATAGALKELAEQSADLAVDLAGKIVQQRLSADEHAALINEAVARFAKLEPGEN